jgi:hypothetical protein
MVIENRDLAAGTRLVAKYKGEQWTIEVLPGEPKTYGFVGKRPDGAAQVFKSPSAAGSAVMGGTACNGWRFWSLEGGEASPTPVRTATAKTSKAASAKTPRAGRKARETKTVIFEKYKDQGGLKDGEVRYVCHACVAHFIATPSEFPGGVVEACPEGHRNDDPELTSAAPAEDVAADKAEL